MSDLVADHARVEQRIRREELRAIAADGVLVRRGVSLGWEGDIGAGAEDVGVPSIYPFKWTALASVSEPTLTDDVTWTAGSETVAIVTRGIWEAEFSASLFLGANAVMGAFTARAALRIVLDGVQQALELVGPYPRIDITNSQDNFEGGVSLPPMIVEAGQEFRVELLPDFGLNIPTDWHVAGFAQLDLTFVSRLS